MYKPHTIPQFKVWEFLQDHFVLDACYVWPLSREGLILEDREGEQIAFAYQDGLVAECELPVPGGAAEQRDFIQLLNAIYPKAGEQTFEAKAGLWLDRPCGLTYPQALGLTAPLLRHYLKFPIPTEAEVLVMTAQGAVTEETYRSILLWYLDGHTAAHHLVIGGVDGYGTFVDLFLHYHQPGMEHIQFYLLE